MIKLFFKEIKKGIILWFYLAIILLYGFSVKMPVIGYSVPFVFFLYYTSTRFNEIIKIKKEFLIYYMLIAAFAIFYLIGGLLYLDYKIRIKIGIYILFFFIPLSIVFYNEFIKLDIKDSIKKLFIVFFTIGLLIFLVYYNGLISRFRYQQVGNILAATCILSFHINNKYWKWITFFFFLFLVIIVGSRQSLISIILVSALYFFIKNFKALLFVILTGVLVFFNRVYLTEKLTIFAYEHGYETLKRLAFALNSENILGKRSEIYSSLISKIKIYPNLSFSPNKLELYPHNFFLEYFIVCGLVIGLLFLLFVFYILNRSLKKMKEQTFFYFVMIFFLPFNISSGFTAAKYFVFFLPVLIYWSSKNKEYFNKI